MTDNPYANKSRWKITPTRFGGVMIAIISLLCFGSWIFFDAGEWQNVQELDLKLTKPMYGGLEGKPLAEYGEKWVTMERPGENGAAGEKSTSYFYMWMGTDQLGRSLLWRCLFGGVISLGIGFAAAGISVFIGTAWGLIAGYAGGKVDAAMMRIVDILYGLPYILLVLLLVVAIDGFLSRIEASYAELQKAPDALMNDGNKPSDSLVADRKAYQKALEKQKDAESAADAERAILGTMKKGTVEYENALANIQQFEAKAKSLDPTPWSLRLITKYPQAINLVSLLVAIGSISWLTLARVVRGQVLSIKSQPFVEAARSIGAPTPRILVRHILPNLVGPIIVYTTLTVPQAILQESFLSFLGIGVEAPLPSWGNLASEGLKQLNPVMTRWWLLVWPCVLLGVTLLSLNFLGDGLRDYYDPKAKQN